MNSYIYGRFQWVACHECELGGNSLALCEIGLKVTTEKSNYFKRGCWTVSYTHLTLPTILRV